MKALFLDNKKPDVLTDSFGRILIRLGLPMCSSTFLSLFTAVLVNNMYSKHIGAKGFSVMGALSLVLGLGTDLIGSVTLAAWIKGAHHYREDNEREAGKQFVNVVCTLILLALMVIVVMASMQNSVFRWMNVPDAIWEDARVYYFMYIWIYLFNGIYTFLSYINTARSKSSVVWLFSLLPICCNLLFLFFYLRILGLGVRGVPMAAISQLFVMIVALYAFLLKQGVLSRIKKEQLHLDFKQVIQFLGYGLLLVSRTLILYAGSLTLSRQVNKYLSVDYIGVIAVVLPIEGFLGILSNICTAVFPQNYRTGRVERLKSLMRKFALLALGYGMLCFVVYAFIGRWYFGRLFQNADIISMGANYWFWYGLGVIPLALIYIFSTFMNAVDQGKVSVLASVGSTVGYLLCALWLVPEFGNIGRSMVSLIGGGLEALTLIIGYMFFKRKIYEGCFREDATYEKIRKIKIDH